MRLKFYSLILIGLLNVLQAAKPCHAQVLDTLRVMQYNLLSFGKEVYDCNESNNGKVNKTAYLRTILNFTQPDIFAVNELDGKDADAQYLLNYALNQDGRNRYKYANIAGEYMENALFYNSDKLALKRQDRIFTGNSERPINVYQLYYKKNLRFGSDTTYLTCFVVHLKEGEERSSRRIRANATQLLMDYREENSITGNALVLGNFNVYDSDEEAFQNLVNPMIEDLVLEDPLNMLGQWHESEEFASYHTQSTHTNGTCTAPGGLNDRFDFILMSPSFRKGSQKLKYLPGSYETLGQDGQHFNRALTDGANELYNTELTQALYNVSDHLPVLMEVKVLGENVYSQSRLLEKEHQLKFNNPVREKLNLKIDWGNQANLRVEVLSIIGKVVYRKKVQVHSGIHSMSIPFSAYEKGMYLLKVSDDQNQFLVKKILKN